MRVVHVLSPSPFAAALHDAFGRWFPAAVLRDNAFWLTHRENPWHMLDGPPEVTRWSHWQLPRALLRLPRGTRLVLHGLFGNPLLLGLAMRQDLLPDATWMLWGGDLELPAPGARQRRRLEWEVRRRVAPRLGQVASTIEADHRTAVREYGTTQRWCETFYPGIVDTPVVHELRTTLPPVSAIRRVVVGNSATATNHHMQILELLENVDTGDVEFFLPLSYGDPEYRDRVREAWHARFGARCRFLLELMPRDEYTRFLASVDAGLYGYTRQQGLGNVMALLALGKVVYLPGASILSQYMAQKGFAVLPTPAFAHDVGRTLDPALAARLLENSTRGLALFSDAGCKDVWSKIIGVAPWFERPR